MESHNISHNAQGQRQGQVKVEAVQALHLEAYRLVLSVCPEFLELPTGPIFTKLSQ